MSDKELFAVIVRALGLVLFIIGIVGLGVRLIDYFLLPPYEHSGSEASFTAELIFIALVGVLLLSTTGWVVRLFYKSKV